MYAVKPVPKFPDTVNKIFMSSLQDMTSAINRFEHVLSIDPYNMSDATLAGSAMISCHVIEDPHGPMVARPEDDSFEGTDLSLIVAADTF
jgi:hypothetical protein